MSPRRFLTSEWILAITFRINWLSALVFSNFAASSSARFALMRSRAICGFPPMPHADIRKVQGAQVIHRAASLHRRGDGHMSLESERCRKCTVAIPVVAIADLVAVSLGEQSVQPQQQHLSGGEITC